MSSEFAANGGPGAPRPMSLTAIPGGTTAKARGYADGYAHGWAAGSGVAAERSEHESQEQSAQAESARLVLTHRVERAIDVLAEAASAAGQRTVPVLAESAQLLIKGAMEIAEAVLGAELSDRGVALRAAMGRAMRLDGADRVVKIRLNPEDLAALDDLRTTVGSPTIPADVELIADPTLNPGDAISELTEGMLDARIDQAVARVRQELGLIGPPIGGERE